MARRFGRWRRTRRTWGAGLVLTLKASRRRGWGCTEALGGLAAQRLGTEGCLESKPGVGKVPAHFNFQLNLY